MYRKVVLFFSVLFFTAISPMSGLTSSNMEKLNEQADEALQLAKMERYEESVKILETFSNVSLATASQTRALFVDELSVVSKVYEEAMETLKANNRSHEEKVISVMKLRLVVDAIQSEYQPLWTEMEDDMATTIEESLLALVEKNKYRFHQSLDNLLRQYDLIYASLQIDVNPETLQEVDARIRYIDQYRAEILENQGEEKELVVLKTDLQSIFDDLKEDETDPSLWWVIISTGSLIVISLSYTGWRKYVGMKRNQKGKNKLKN